MERKKGSKKINKDFGYISKIISENAFNKSTYPMIRSYAMNTKVDLIEDVKKEDVLINLIIFNQTRELGLLLNDYGIDFLANEWSNFIKQNSENFIFRAQSSELEMLAYKMEVIFRKFNL